LGASEEQPPTASAARPALLLFLLALGTAAPAEAAAGVVGPALSAYGHYLSMIGVAGSLAAERLLVKPGMSVDEEKALRSADLAYAVSLVALLATGAARANVVRARGSIARRRAFPRAENVLLSPYSFHSPAFSSSPDRPTDPW
jgi:hypothetical protein